VNDIFVKLGAFVDIVRITDLFTSPSCGESFHFNHMDMGTQNILVDEEFNFRAVIDWEFAQTAPCQVNHYPMPFPLLPSDAEIDEILKDPNHIAYNNTTRQAAARDLYRQMFQDAEDQLQRKGRPLQSSVARISDGAASRIYGCFERMGRLRGMDKILTHEMVRLAHGFNREMTNQYLEKAKSKIKGALIFSPPTWPNVG
jgi:hypothetical protein